jgi:Ca-activated chloride channel family protein
MARHRYSFLDPDLIRRLLAEMGLRRLFNQLLLQSGGDVEEAMRWMRLLQERGYIDPNVDLEAFFAQLMQENVIGQDGNGNMVLGAGGERQIRRDALDEIFGGLQKSMSGYHSVANAGLGTERLTETRPYQFGDDPMSIDSIRSLQNAMRHNDPADDITITEDDLAVFETEHSSNCATVVMIDISHSMILYGEDRFTPAKKVAMALSHLIRTQYPGDSLSLVLFHDSAEEVPLSQLARVKVGPYYTNTREGLRMAQRILQRQRKDMKQIVMITDGKPSALTLEDGRIYKNAFGLDPLVVSETLEEVSKCKRAGILINTFMLASEYGLIQFVQKVTQMCRGKAYFTTPYTLGQYLLMDYMSRKTRTVH